MTEPLPLRTQMKFKRGFSDLNFVAGGTSEFDRAVETGAKALYEFEPELNQGEPIPWESLNTHVRQKRREWATVVLGAVNGL